MVQDVDFSRRNSKPPIVLHIGMNKTGTTSLQAWLSQNAQALSDLGFLYPQTGRAPQEDAHHLLSEALGFYPARPAWTAEARKHMQRKLLQEIGHSTCHTTILSSECFINHLHLAKCQEFFHPFDIKIVIYLRRHDHWWVSLYTQIAKTQIPPCEGSGPEAFIDHQEKNHRSMGNYRLLIETWAKVFGQENIRVYPFEKQQNQPRLEAHFLQHIGIHGGQKFNFQPKRNPSPSIRATMLMESVQRLKCLDDLTRSRLIQLIIQDDRHQSNKSATDMTLSQWLNPQYRRLLIQRHQNDYEHIARTYMGREDGILFIEPMPEDDLNWQEPQPLTENDLINYLAEKLTSERESHDQIRQRIIETIRQEKKHPIRTFIKQHLPPSAIQWLLRIRHIFRKTIAIQVKNS